MRYIYVLIAVFMITGALQAQLSIGVGFNLDRQPVWGPTGYDHVEYYYLPDIDAYYNVPQHRFYYNEGGRWVGRSQLPRRYHDFDLYNSYKVVVNDREPYRNHEKYRSQYASYKGRHDQQPIRDSREEKYFINKNHPEHNKWVKEQRHDNGNHNGNRNGNGRGNQRGNGNGRGNGGNNGNGNHDGKKN
jgi:hypothetical protein